VPDPPVTVTLIVRFVPENPVTAPSTKFSEFNVLEALTVCPTTMELEVFGRFTTNVLEPVVTEWLVTDVNGGSILGADMVNLGG
jgi:hypothetical protein